MQSERNNLVRDAVELSLAGSLPRQARALILREFPDISSLFRAGTERLRALGLPEETASALAARRHRPEADGILDLSVKTAFYIFIAGYKPYPEILREIADPPLVLYARGSVATLDLPAIAIVGTRHPSFYGLQMAEGLAGDLAERGIAVASGLARGIDGAAHRGCLASGGRTLAVLGSGIDVIYPREHRRLAEEIARAGLILSEYPPGTPPAPRNFPVRNRIISGLALGTVVVEAREASGSLITARAALEQNREVFALPGNVTSPASVGPNYLIKEGAKLVQSWRDIVEELPRPVRERIADAERPAGTQPPRGQPLGAEEAAVLERLAADRATQFDELVGAGRLAIVGLSKVLLELELRGLVRALPGGLYLKVARRRE
ncbi:MAG: DNA-protecting protein DprA [Acidobacteria bacterium]|nr:MAG: DNA-protecting protein DprA [Acidobacteriota bacterium]